MEAIKSNDEHSRVSFAPISSFRAFIRISSPSFRLLRARARQVRAARFFRFLNISRPLQKNAGIFFWKKFFFWDFYGRYANSTT